MITTTFNDTMVVKTFHLPQAAAGQTCPVPDGPALNSSVVPEKQNYLFDWIC